MAVTRKIISIEATTITVPLGEIIDLDHIPNVLYVRYNVAPFRGYITFTESMKRELLVLNPRTAASPTNPSVAVIRNTPEKIIVDDANGKRITNIPTDIQQEVILKGGIKNGTSSNAGNGETIITYEPLVFYISILVGGIDWRPASRFPSEIDLIDAQMKEPVTSSDIPAVDAYQYLISMQTRSSAEDYMLESLKQTLAKKMILARDVNYLGACLLAVERAYFDLIQRIERLEKRVEYIEKTWLPELEGRLFTAEINIKNIWNNLEKNWNDTARGLYAARSDAYWRVHAALRHYGSTSDRLNGSTAWTAVPIFGTHGIGDFNASDSYYELISVGNYSSYKYDRILINPESGDDETLVIRAYNPEDSTIEDYKKHVYGIKNMNTDIKGHFFHSHIWDSAGSDEKGSEFYNLTASGNGSILPEECFHNIIVKNSLGSGTRGAIITEEHIGYYYTINKDIAGRASQMVFKVHGGADYGHIHLDSDTSAWYSDEQDKYLRMGVKAESHGLMRYYASNKPYVFFGRHNEDDHSTGFTVQPDRNETADAYKHAFITGDRILFANMDTGSQYMNFANKKGYTVMNFGSGADGFYIGKTDKGAIIEYEVDSGGYCGLALTKDGLKFYGIAQSTLDQLKAYVGGGDKNGSSNAVSGKITGTIKGTISGTITEDDSGENLEENLNKFENDNRLKNVLNCNCGKRSNE